MRLFFAVIFENTVKDRFLTVQNDLRKHSLRGNFTLYDNLHLTLVFIGEVTESRADILRGIAGSLTVEPFMLRFDHLGRFRRNGGDLIWIGTQKSTQLLSLHESLASQIRLAGFQVEARPYTPHLTLARGAQFNEGFSLNGYSNAFKPIDVQVTRASLMQSERKNGRLTYTALV